MYCTFAVPSYVHVSVLCLEMVVDILSDFSWLLCGYTLYMYNVVCTDVYVQYALKKRNRSTVNGNGTTARYRPKYHWSTSEVPLGTSEVPLGTPLSYARFYPCTGNCTRTRLRSTRIY